MHFYSLKFLTLLSVTKMSVLVTGIVVVNVVNGCIFWTNVMLNFVPGN